MEENEQELLSQISSLEDEKKEYVKLLQDRQDKIEEQDKEISRLREIETVSTKLQADLHSLQTKVQKRDEAFKKLEEEITQVQEQFKKQVQMFNQVIKELVYKRNDHTLTSPSKGNSPMKPQTPIPDKVKIEKLEHENLFILAFLDNSKKQLKSSLDNVQVLGEVIFSILNEYKTATHVEVQAKGQE